MKRLPIVTVITFAVAAGCATSPRAAGPNPNVSPRDTTAVDTTMRDTSRTLPDTRSTALRLSIAR
jgi:hypothetical protein